MASKLDIDYQIVENAINSLSDNQIEILVDISVRAYLKKNNMALVEGITEADIIEVQHEPL